MTTPDPAGPSAGIIPAERPEATLADIAIADCFVTDEDYKTPPAWLVESISEWGVFQPIVVTGPHPTIGGYKVGEGRKRLRAAGAAGLTTIPAHIFPPDTPVSVLALAGNYLRQRSPASELAAADDLLARGLDRKGIAGALHIPQNVVDKLLSLRGLRTELRKALDTGALAVGPAYAAAKLGDSRQKALVDILGAKGKLTGHDVREARNAGSHNAQLGLTIPALDGLADDEATANALREARDPRVAWREALAHLDAVKATLPVQAEPWVHQSLAGLRQRAALGAVQGGTPEPVPAPPPPPRPARKAKREEISPERLAYSAGWARFRAKGDREPYPPVVAENPELVTHYIHGWNDALDEYTADEQAVDEQYRDADLSAAYDLGVSARAGAGSEEANPYSPGSGAYASWHNGFVAEPEPTPEPADDPRARACPKCNAAPGEPCHGPTTDRALPYLHAARRTA